MWQNTACIFAKEDNLYHIVPRTIGLLKNHIGKKRISKDIRVICLSVVLASRNWFKVSIIKRLLLLTYYTTNYLPAVLKPSLKFINHLHKNKTEGYKTLYKEYLIQATRNRTFYCIPYVPISNWTKSVFVSSLFNL